MKKKYILISLIFIILAVLMFNSKSYAANLDEIKNYVVTVDPRMNDGTLDITYEITWKVLDSTTEGPLEWVKIGTPNENFDTATAISNNIKSITKYSGSYVKITFDKKYYAGEEITFKYSIHQSYMYKISWGKCNYKFTPAWFTDAKVDSMTVRWNMDEVKKSDTKSSDGNYLVWYKKDMSEGQKLTVNVKYEKSAFGYLDTNKQRSYFGNSSSTDYSTIIIIIFFVIVIACAIIGDNGSGGYYRHSGFYGGTRHGGPRGRGPRSGGCAHSSCACAHSSCASSCACACAGSGRAGCSRKDFYGTNLETKKIKEIEWESIT